MKIEIIKVSKEFKSSYGGVWLGMEASVSEDEDKLKAYATGNELLEQAWSAINPHITWNQPVQTVINKETERIEIAIDNCTSKEELLLLQNDAIKNNLVPQYLKKQKELTNR